MTLQIPDGASSSGHAATDLSWLGPYGLQQVWRRSLLPIQLLTKP
jgi:hypothetical protein